MHWQTEAHVRSREIVTAVFLIVTVVEFSGALVDVDADSINSLVSIRAGTIEGADAIDAGFDDSSASVASNGAFIDINANAIRISFVSVGARAVKGAYAVDAVLDDSSTGMSSPCALIDINTPAA